MTDDGYDRSRDGEQIAPPLYPSSTIGQPDQDGNVTVTGNPIRGPIHLLTVYSPPWWYAACGACQGMTIGGEDSPDAPILAVWADLHRCGRDRIEESMEATHRLHTIQLTRPDSRSASRTTS